MNVIRDAEAIGARIKEDLIFVQNEGRIGEMYVLPRAQDQEFPQVADALRAQGLNLRDQGVWLDADRECWLVDVYVPKMMGWRDGVPIIGAPGD